MVTSARFHPFRSSPLVTSRSVYLLATNFTRSWLPLVAQKTRHGTYAESFHHHLLPLRYRLPEVDTVSLNDRLFVYIQAL
jgi:hypothetical protein